MNLLHCPSPLRLIYAHNSSVIPAAVESVVEAGQPLAQVPSEGLELRRKSRKMFPARCYARPTVAAGATKVATAIAIFSVTYK